MKIPYSPCGKLSPSESHCGSGDGGDSGHGDLEDLRRRGGHGVGGGLGSGFEEYLACGHGYGDSGHGYGGTLNGSGNGYGFGAGIAFPFGGR